MWQFRGNQWKLPRFCRQPLGNSTSSPIGWQWVFGHFPAAFLYSLRIAQRLSNSLWAFPSGFPTPFEYFPAAVQQPLRAVPSGCRLKCRNFQLFFLKGRISVYIFKKSKEHLKILKTISGSSSSTDLSNNITFSQSQSHATVLLSSFYTCVFPLFSIGGHHIGIYVGDIRHWAFLYDIREDFVCIKVSYSDIRKKNFARACVHVNVYV
jgi:hypothetical protein